MRSECDNVNFEELKRTASLQFAILREPKTVAFLHITREIRLVDLCSAFQFQCPLRKMKLIYCNVIFNSIWYVMCLHMPYAIYINLRSEPFSGISTFWSFCFTFRLIFFICMARIGAGCCWWWWCSQVRTRLWHHWTNFRWTVGVESTERHIWHHILHVASTFGWVFFFVSPLFPFYFMFLLLCLHTRHLILMKIPIRITSQGHKLIVEDWWRLLGTRTF